MSKTIVVYGSSTGTCEAIAKTLGQKLGANVIEVSSLTDTDVKNADNLVLGTSTWGAGEMQDDWYDGVKVLKSVGLSGKKVAIFGCGDSESYSDTFCGGMKELYDAAKAAGATMVGDNVSTTTATPWLTATSSALPSTMSTRITRLRSALMPGSPHWDFKAVQKA